MKKHFNQTMTDEYQTSTSQNNLHTVGDPTNRLGSSRQQLMTDEMSQELTYLAREAPLDGGESTLAAPSYSQLAGSSGAMMGSDEAENVTALDERSLSQLKPDNVEIGVKAPLKQAGFLVSFMVDARGGAMRGCRHSGVRVIIPANSAPQPMRITCRYLRRERLVHPPPLMEGEACASRIMEVGPAGAKFLGPVVIEVPHFASLRNQEREIIILRSDNGQVWREHLADHVADERLIEAIVKAANDLAITNQRESQAYSDTENLDPNGMDSADESLSASLAAGHKEKRLTRIVTDEFPQYFAIISRVRQQVHSIGPEGRTVSSDAVPKVQTIFTEGALTKRIKIGLQDKETKPKSAEVEVEIKEENGKIRLKRAQQPAKGRKFLACFGSQQSGSQQSLELPRSGSSSSADGDDEDSGIQASRTAKKAGGRGRRPSQLVPDDYYAEAEHPLILNLEPRTFGKRLACSSAQTDSRGAGKLSTSARPGKRSRCLMCSRRQKAEMTIECEPATTVATVTKELTVGESPQEKLISVAPDASIATLDKEVAPSKWRTCTIQTDSDSVTVNYVTVSGQPQAPEQAEVAKKETGAQPDDGYVSGSGGSLNKSDLKRREKEERKRAKKAKEREAQADKRRRKEEKARQKAEKKRDKRSTTEEVAIEIPISHHDESAPELVVRTPEAELKKTKEPEARESTPPPPVAASTIDSVAEQLVRQATDEAIRASCEQLDKERAEAKKREKKKKKAEKKEKRVSKGEKSAPFFGRLFSSRSKAPKSKSNDAESYEEKSHDHTEEKHIVISEMYPKDPNDTNGEMILEVNVPKSLIERQLSVTDQALESSGASSKRDQPGSEHSSVIVSPGPTSPTSVTRHSIGHDQQEDTLVNVSQLATSSEAAQLDEDRATENELQDESLAGPAVARSGQKRASSSAKKPAELAKGDKELEAKLKREAKKRTEEEKKLKKREAKEQAKRAKLEKKQAEMERKRQEKEAKEKAKLEKKNLKKQKAPGAKDASVAVGEQQHQQEPKAEVSYEGLVPVSEESETKQFVEEIYGDDGTMTKITKKVETKSVTLRGEAVETRAREMEAEEYDRLEKSGQLDKIHVFDSKDLPTRAGQVAETSRSEWVLPAELVELQSAPSCFESIHNSAKLQDGSLSERKRNQLLKKEIKKRTKLNEKLVKQAQGIAKSQAKLAQRESERAEAEIRASDEAAKRATREAKRAKKEAQKADKVAQAAHKKMDKVDEKLAKRQKKIDKRQAKLDKQADKVAKKEEKKRIKLAKKEAKRAKKEEDKKDALERKSSQRGSKKSIKREDIGEPTLRSSSRLSLGPTGLVVSSGTDFEQQQHQQQLEPTQEVASSNEAVIEREKRATTPISEEDIHVDMSLDDHQVQSQQAEALQKLGHDDLVEYQSPQQLPSEPVSEPEPELEPELEPEPEPEPAQTQIEHASIPMKVETAFQRFDSKQSSSSSSSSKSSLVPEAKPATPIANQSPSPTSNPQEEQFEPQQWIQYQAPDSPIASPDSLEQHAPSPVSQHLETSSHEAQSDLNIHHQHIESPSSEPELEQMALYQHQQHINQEEEPDLVKFSPSPDNSFNTQSPSPVAVERAHGAQSIESQSPPPPEVDSSSPTGHQISDAQLISLGDDSSLSLAHEQAPTQQRVPNSPSPEVD